MSLSMLRLFYFFCLNSSFFFWTSNYFAKAQSTTTKIRYECDPCVERENYMVRAIVHGTKTDPFWQQAHAAALQAAKDMRVQLDWELYQDIDSSAQQQANDILAVIADKTLRRPDALVVSIPNNNVKAAVEKVVKAGIAVLGINTGANAGQDIGVLEFVAPDDHEGGKLAGETMIRLQVSDSDFDGNKGSSGNALFVNDDVGNSAMTERLAGFKEALLTSKANSTSSKTTSLEVEELGVAENFAGYFASSKFTKVLTKKLNGCSYSGGILLSSPRTLDAVIAAYQANDCSLDSQPLGLFETSNNVYDAIGRNYLSFAIDNQQYLQGALSMILASLVATTGKSLAASSESYGGSYFTGPMLIQKDTLPNDKNRICEHEAFPVCPTNEYLYDGGLNTKGDCSCTDRSKVKIAGVTHGITSDSFWDPVYAASTQAAHDMGVQLLNEQFEPRDNDGNNGAVLYNKMARRIRILCEIEEIDGLFVTIPSDIVLDAIRECQELYNIPVVSINAGADLSNQLGLFHHIGMIEYNAGKAAGKYMIQHQHQDESNAKNNIISSALCVNHAPSLSVTVERCKGFQDAVESEGIVYLGEVSVPNDNFILYIDRVETFVRNFYYGENEEENNPKNDIDDFWQGLGILALGGSQHPSVTALQALHPQIKVGAFDVSLDLYDGIDEGAIQFGMDQQAYLQGYMPVVLLTYLTTTVNQRITNQVIESGPSFVISSPTEDQKACEDLMFVACDVPQSEQEVIYIEEVTRGSSSSKSEEQNSDAGLRGNNTALTMKPDDDTVSTSSAAPETISTTTNSQSGVLSKSITDRQLNHTKWIVILVVVGFVLIFILMYIGMRLNLLIKHIENLQSQRKELRQLSLLESLYVIIKPAEDVAYSAIVSAATSTIDVNRRSST